MILFLDDERDYVTVCGVKFREKANLPPFTDEQKNILRAARINDEVVTVRSVKEAQEYIHSCGVPDMIFFVGY